MEAEAGSRSGSGSRSGCSQLLPLPILLPAQNARVSASASASASSSLLSSDVEAEALTWAFLAGSGSRSNLGQPLLLPLPASASMRVFWGYLQKNEGNYLWDCRKKYFWVEFGRLLWKSHLSILIRNFLTRNVSLHWWYLEVAWKHGSGSGSRSRLQISLEAEAEVKLHRFHIPTAVIAAWLLGSNKRHWKLSSDNLISF